MPLENTIRDVTVADLPFVQKANQAALPHVSSATLADLEKFREIAGYFRIIENQNKAAGFLIALRPGLEYASDNYRWFCQNFSNFYYIDRIVIVDGAQGKGLGRAFYQDIIRTARPLAPCLTCEVNSRPPNPQSMAFHQTFGFKPVGTQQTEGGSKEVTLLSLEF